MVITEQDIRKLRRDLERDLEAVARVETLFASRNGRSAIDSQSTETSGRGQLKQLCIEVLKPWVSAGIRPRDVIKSVTERGYKFKSKAGAAGSVSTVLKRLLEDKKVEKRDRRYFWKGKTATDNA